MFYRTAKMLEAGIKPVYDMALQPEYSAASFALHMHSQRQMTRCGAAMRRYVFDGKPPAMKKEELARRCAALLTLRLC